MILCKADEVIKLNTKQEMKINFESNLPSDSKIVNDKNLIFIVQLIKEGCIYLKFNR